MKNILIILWSDNIFKRLIHFFAIFIFIGMYSIGIYFLILETPELWNLGLLYFSLLFFTRLIIGIPLCLVGVLPYYICSVASKNTISKITFLIASVIIFYFDIKIRFSSLFFPQTSTDSLAVLFIPFYFSVPVLILWGIFSLDKWTQKIDKHNN